MRSLTPDQRADLFSQAAIRTGIHQPLLAALHAVHHQPNLPDGETGLGITPANQILLAAIATLPGQIHYAANTLRSLTNALIAQGWQGEEFWNRELGCYREPFLQAVAKGFVAPPLDGRSARLERSEFDTLQQVYRQQVVAEFRSTGIPASQAFLEPALGQFGNSLPSQYLRVAYQRAALLELVRLWWGLDDRQTTLSALSKTDPAIADPLYLDAALLRFFQQALSSYASYPHQREALLRLVQQWQQLDSRAATLLALQQGISPDHSSQILDTALMAFIQRLPRLYEGTGNQRNAVVEGFRQWQQLDSRPAILVALGVNSDLFNGAEPDPNAITAATVQVDRALVQFLQRLPLLYEASSVQRASLIHLTQLWRNLTTPKQAVQSLIDDFQQLEGAPPDSPEASAPPRPFPIAPPPSHWTLDTLQLQAAIMPNSRFTWAEATQGGLFLPPNQDTLDAIARMAVGIQSIRDRLDRPLTLLRWYCPAQHTPGRFPSDRHAIGDAVLFYCAGLTAQQIYGFLDPWWTGGLGRYGHFPLLCYVDLRGDRVRWDTL